MKHAQIGGDSGFDHRILKPEKAKKIVHYKLSELKRLFPDFSLDQFFALGDSEYSIEESIVNVNGQRLSSIFLTHLYFYLRTRGIFGKKKNLKRVIEIGSGYGSLARIYKTMEKEISFVLVDLPESLFYAHTFLAASFPGAKIKYVSDKNSVRIDDYDFVLVPLQHYQALDGQKFDLTINTGSLQEMPDAAVRFWMEFIQNSIQTELFYSWNYFLNNKKLYDETSHEELNLIAPILDPHWDLKYFRINERVLTVDCCTRNWLEVCVQRKSTKNVIGENCASELFRTADQYPRGTNYWFANVWMAIWCNPKSEYVKTMLDAIDDFSKGLTFGVPNNFYFRVRQLSPGFKDLFKHFFRLLRWRLEQKLNKAGANFRLTDDALSDERNEYGEKKFYRSLLPD